MKVKVGGMIFDSKKQPVMIILSDNDKLNIRNMPKHLTKYCQYPDDFDEDEIKAWMNTE